MELNNLILKLQQLTPHKTKPGGSSCMTQKQKYINILVVDMQSRITSGQFLCGDHCA
jgi:hypothetical protein